MENRDYEKEHKQKVLVTIVITGLVLLYYVFYFGLLIYLIDVPFLKIIFGVIPLIFGGVMINICIQRIKEIKEGEEDDLSKY